MGIAPIDSDVYKRNGTKVYKILDGYVEINRRTGEVEFYENGNSGDLIKLIMELPYG